MYVCIYTLSICANLLDEYFRCTGVVSQQVQDELVHQFQANVVRGCLMKLDGLLAGNVNRSIYVPLYQLVQLFILKTASGSNRIIEAAVPSTKYTRETVSE